MVLARRIRYGFASLTAAMTICTATANSSPVNWSEIPLPSLDGGQLSADDLIGHTVLVVNTASMCGFTPQYEGLQMLWERYRVDGLVVLGVPSDNFGGQEYDSNDETKTFCEVTYGIDFPMLTQQNVKGDEAHALFAWIANQAGLAGQPRWNFFKYLIDRDGNFVRWFSSMTTPGSRDLQQSIEDILYAE
mgnify:CR=1 FL=1